MPPGPPALLSAPPPTRPGGGSEPCHRHEPAAAPAFTSRKWLRLSHAGALVVAAILISLLPGRALAQDSLSTYRFHLGAGRVVKIPAIKVKSGKGKIHEEMVSLKGTAAALGGSVNPAEEAGSFAMLLGGTIIRFSSEYPSIVRVGDRIVSLSRDARRVGSDLYLPTDFLTRVVKPILNGTGGPPTTEHASGSVVLPVSNATTTPAAAEAAPPGAMSSSSSAANSTSGDVSAPALIAASQQPGTPPGAPGATAPSKGLLVVIDPGHGGAESGAAGKSGLLEKEVTLDIARRLKEILTRQSGLNVLLTRTQDDIVGLDDRTALANQTHADLFLSIHVNAAPRRDARGAETYYLADKSKNEEIRTLAAIENNAAGVDREKLGDVSAGLDLVLWDLAQGQYLEESSRLAEAIQKQLNEALSVRDRGIKQAPFRVLMGATMPAVLVEVGFISNPAEEKSLKDGEYREKIAQAVSRAVLVFLSDAKRRMPGAASVPR
jgi:N-acetylmuramoyl-L-alanine amidase